jgi:hypothetical protein
MEPIKFVTDIRSRVVQNDNIRYENLLESEKEINDSQWKEIVSIYRRLSKDEKNKFIDFLRLIQVNTVSHVFGILDGSTYLNEERETFQLISNSDQAVINGDLQDLFLEMEE